MSGRTGDKTNLFRSAPTIPSHDTISAPPIPFGAKMRPTASLPFSPSHPFPEKNIQPQTEKHQVKWYGPTMYLYVLDLQRSPSSKRRADQTGEGNIMSLRAIRSSIMRFAPSRPSPARVSRYDFQSWIVVVVVVGAHKKGGRERQGAGGKLSQYPTDSSWLMDGPDL